MEIRALHIEDDKWFADLFRSLLKPYGITITHRTDDLEHTLDFLKEYNYDVILVDLNLNSDRYSGVKIIKEIVKNSHVPIIVVSGEALDDKLIYESIQAGAVTYIKKWMHSESNYEESTANKIKDVIKKQDPMSQYVKRLKLEEELTKTEIETIKILDEKNMTIKQKAEKIGVKPNTLKVRIERIRRRFTKEELNNIIKKYL